MKGDAVGRMAVIAAVLILTVAGSVFADPSVRTRPDVADFDSAVPIPSNPDFQITADGHLIYQGDTVISCEDVQPDFITPREAYEEQAGICAEYGFPPGKDLPATSGPPLLLIPLVLLLTAGLLVRRILHP